jgi:hypothetical protein
VPQAASAPAAGPGPSSLGKQLVEVPGSTRLAFQQNAQKPATVKGNIPIRNLAPPPTKRKSPIVKIITWAVALVAAGVGVYFGWGFVEQWQEKANAKSREEARNSDGGQVGHIVNLNKVLDATDPSNPRLDKLAGGGSQASGPRQRSSSVPGAIPVPADGAGAPAGNLALVPPVYTLEVTQAKVPEGAVNGMISGSNFVAELVRLDPVGPAQVLRLTQGTPPVPDREILIYLRLKPGEKLSGHTWTISSDMKGTDVPPVYKQWKVKAGYAPARKAYVSGYVMKLELGQLANGALPGKIYIALPDNEQSVAGGVFNATTTLADVIGAATALPGAPAAPVPGVTPSAQSAFDQRYAPVRRK